MENMNNHPDQRVAGNGLHPPPSHPIIQPHIHEPFFNHCNFQPPNGHDPHISGNFTYPHVPVPPNAFPNHNQPYNHFNPMNGDSNHSFSAGGPPPPPPPNGFGFNNPMPRPGRKRGWLSAQGASPDQVDVKLYLAPVPRTSTENDIRLVFEEHGTIVEVVLLFDKKTGERQGSCFVKFATLDQAERAIKALSNQYTFPGESSPIVVRFADRGKGRPGIRGLSQVMDKKIPSEEVVDKVFVGHINKEASKREIEEVFSPYGHIENIFIAQSRGYCFVKFSNKDMALAAIKGLNNAFTMRGCDHPLIVRFAEPKKLKTGEPRVNHHMPGSAFGPCSQEPPVWLPPNFGDSIGGNNLPMAPHHPTITRPQVAPQIQNWEPANTLVQQPFPCKQAHPQLSPMPSQSMQPQKLSSQPVDTEVLKQSHSTDSSTQNIEKQLNSQPSKTGGSPCAVVGSTSPEMPEYSDDEVYPDCDWSEHTCPDGNKYYYNCVTYESRWEKPEEYALYESKQDQEDHDSPNS